jgi:hypothetical protein
MRRRALRQLQLEPQQLHMFSILLGMLTALLMYSTRNTSTANATMRASTVAAGTAAAAFVL